MPVIMISNWQQGLWTAGPAPKAPKGTLTRMKNVQVMDEGTIATRPGCNTYLSLASTVDGTYVASQHFFKVGTAIYDNSGAAIGVTQAGRRLRAFGMPTYGVPDDIVFFPKPSGIYMRKYYSGAVSNWGISETPVAPVAADSGVAGNLSGTYSYRFAFYSSTTLATSALSEVSNSITLTTNQMTVTNIPLVCTDTQVTHVNIYRSTGSTANSAWYYVDRVVLGSSASYTDNIGDVNLQEQVDYAVTYPPIGNLAGRFNNRMLLLDTTDNPRYVFASMPSQPEVFNSLYYDLVLNSGDTAEAVLQVGDYAYIWGQNNVYRLSIDSSNLFFIGVLNNVPGTPNGRTVAVGTSGVYYQGYDGIYLLSGFSSLDFPQATKVSVHIDSLFRSTDRGGLSLISDNIYTSGTFVGGRYYFTYYGTDSTWHTVIFNEEKKRWKHYTGWQYTAVPTAGAFPLVGLSSEVGTNVTDVYTESGSTYASSCGFTLELPTTVLYHFRNFRFSCECTGTVTIELYDDTTLIYSVDISSPAYMDGYYKHSYPLNTYCLQPEIRVSSNSYFVLRSFEVNVNPVRKETADYSASYAARGAA